MARESNQPLRPGFKLVLGLAALVLLGSLALMLPGVSTRQLSFSEASFTAVSALSVTGLSVITPSQDLTLTGQLVLLGLIQIGGVGYMVLAVTAFRLLGRNIRLVDRLALKDSLGLLSPGGVVELARQILRTVLLIELLGAVALWIAWRGAMPEGKAMFFGMFHAVSAFCNAGFDLFSGHPEHLEGLPRDTATLGIIGTLIYLGGLGIPVLFDMATWKSRRHFSLHTKITVPLTLTLVLAGGLAFYLSEGLTTGVLEGASEEDALVMSFFQSVSFRTAGFVGVPNFENIEASSQLVGTSLMFIGCAPASMGGGITTGTFATLIIALIAYARGRETPIFRGRAIPGEMVRKAAAVLTISLLVVLSATWVLSLTHGQGLRLIGFEVVSAFATCGLSLGMTSELSTFGRLVIMIVMFWGRLGALTVFVSFAAARVPRRVFYPEEKILIG
ncbi:MAG TPA: potassium transporter TrkG [Fimbriimonadaceae bacterium]|nr:potassium transporter TrkG [Fimbriimonadaceae bacterium]